MKEFSHFFSQKWDIPEEIAVKVCEHFKKGDSYYYLCDYVPEISAELDTSTLFDIYSLLKMIKGLALKRKRVYNAYKKAGVLTDETELRIKLSISSAELDDMLLPYRANTRSKGQQALKNGLGTLADIIDNQEEEEGTLEELAEEYIGKDDSFKTVEDVLNGVKDILTERYACDETVRSMVREVGLEEGFFEILPKNKKDKRFIIYRAKLVKVSELTSEEFLKLTDAERKKDVRFKYGIQLFYINELLRHHFIENPNSVGYDLICEAIDDCWTRLLKPMVERDVKDHLFKDAEDWAIHEVEKRLNKEMVQEGESLPIIIVGQNNNKNLIIVALDTKGNLLGATKEQLFQKGNQKQSFKRLRQFLNRNKYSKIIIKDNQFRKSAEEYVDKIIKSLPETIRIEIYKPDSEYKEIVQSKWMKERSTMLEDDMKEIYALGLVYLHPFHIISKIGVKYFNFHPLQKFINDERLELLITQWFTEKELRKGISFVEAPESVLTNFECINDEVLQNIRKKGAKNSFKTKNEILQVDGMTEKIFRNIAGYIVIPQADNPLDRSLVHPMHYEWISKISVELNASFITLINNPERLREATSDKLFEKFYIENKFSEQLRIVQRYPQPVKKRKHRRRLRLYELEEGTVVSGRVTNITEFGVFVDINAVCDGLIHISELTDGYIESADQVVKVDELIDVRILKVSKKKRRISLSMRKATPSSEPRKIRPSQGQLTSLADHFKNL